eukprot:scaffold198952_cov47-Attheya_sp.AAC.1
MELHKPKDRYKEFISIPSTMSNRSKTTLIIVKNGIINNVKISFSVKSAFLMDVLFRVDFDLMELHNPQDRNKEFISSPRTVSNQRGGPKLH